MIKPSGTSQKSNMSPQESWNAHVRHPLQTWEWGEFRARMGIDVVRLNTWQLTFHKIPHTRFTIGYFPKGPAITSSMIEKLRKVGAEKNALYIQLEPDVRADEAKNILLSSVLRTSHRPLFTSHTFILDLTKSEEDLLKSMHSKTRYNLRVAQKHNVTIQEDSSDEGFAEYLKLNDETTSRQGFFAHNHTYHKTMWTIMHQAGIAHLFTATYEGTVLAAWIIFTWGKTMYYPYGASSRLHREVMAPTLLLWEIVKWGKSHGYTAFDLWGALPPQPSTGLPDEHDPWYGFHRFKQGFNPELVAYIGSYDLIIRPFLYRCFTIADSLRWFLLKRGRA